jgi:hypothetical protein
MAPPLLTLKLGDLSASPSGRFTLGEEPPQVSIVEEAGWASEEV